MLLLDLKTAFDTEWTEGLIYKLLAINLNPILVRILHTYLSKRQLAVKLNNIYSSTLAVDSGTPQGSIIGPKLYNIYINDFPKLRNLKIALYADDTLIYTQSHDATVANMKLKIHYVESKLFFDRWKLTLNTTKSENIIFARTFRNKQPRNLLNLDGQIIQPTKTVKYLGVHLDERLNLYARLLLTYGAMRGIYPLMKKHSGLSCESKRLLYKTCIRPCLLYAAPVWCGVSQTRKEKLQKFQNKCLRLVTGNDNYTRITKLHEDANIEYVEESIDNVSEKFFRTQIKKNNLLRDLTKTRRANHGSHKPNYHRLPIFEETASDSSESASESTLHYI